jgi:hypothetical protein
MPSGKSQEWLNQLMILNNNYFSKEFLKVIINKFKLRRKMTASSEEPRCPFCYNHIDQPKELQERKMVQFPVGACGHCGTVYAYDATGHDMGSAFIEALLFACNNDSELAFSLSYGDDYSDAVIGNYDIVTHSIVPEKICNDRFVRGVLLFVKLVDQFREINGQKVKEKMKASLPISKEKLRSEKFSKELVRRYVSENRLEDLVALSLQDSRVIHELQRMLYTPDEEARWNIIYILGKVCERVGEIRPDIVSKLLGNLLQSSAYPGASAWGAIEAVGIIITTKPDLFGDFCMTLLPFITQTSLQKEVTWAVGTIAAVKPGIVRRATQAIRSFLGSSDPVLRGYAAWALGNLGVKDAAEDLKKLEMDEEKLSLFKDSHLEETTVSRLSKEAIEKLAKSK